MCSVHWYTGEMAWGIKWNGACERESKKRRHIDWEEGGGAAVGNGCEYISNSSSTSSMHARIVACRHTSHTVYSCDSGASTIHICGKSRVSPAFYMRSPFLFSLLASPYMGTVYICCVYTINNDVRETRIERIGWRVGDGGRNRQKRGKYVFGIRECFWGGKRSERATTTTTKK